MALAIFEHAARQSMALQGGVIGSIDKSGSVTPGVLVLVECGVMLPSDNGLAVETHTLCSLLKSESGVLSRNDKITAAAKTYTVGSIVSDDGIVVKVSVRD